VASIAVLLASCGDAGTSTGPQERASGSTPAATAAPATSAPAAAAAPAPVAAPATASGTTGTTEATEASTAEKSFPARIVEALNAARAVPRLCGSTAYPAAGPLAWHPRAEQAALVQAQYLQRNNLFTHTGADGSTIGDRMTATGYVWQTVGENLAAGYPDFAGVLQGWLDSPSHCANVMNGAFVDVGVALVQGTASNTYRTYWAMAAGRPR
jgi:uncharacterized protein YkwD